jgi:hypothetical protein
LFLFSLERDDKMSNLEERADALEDGSKQFETRFKKKVLFGKRS